MLDVGCGPGRLVEALRLQRVTVLGIDAAPSAIARARAAGRRIVQRSVFDPLPREGTWSSVLLFDGNIGIGGDPNRLLVRIRDLMTSDGCVIVELEPPGVGVEFGHVELEVATGMVGTFPWCWVGCDGDRRCRKREPACDVDDCRSVDGRWFAELRTVADTYDLSFERVAGEAAVNLVRIATWADVPDGQPTAASTEGVDLVIIRRGDEHSVLHGRCLHRGALLADGEIRGDDLICGLHGWDYRIESGVSAYNNGEALAKFASVIDGDGLFVDRDDVIKWKLQHPQPYSPDVYQGLYVDPHGTIEEPYVMRIHELAANGLTKVGHHGFVAAMGVARQQLPSWDSIQFVTAQLARLPLLDDVPVGNEVCIGPNAAKPLWLDMPLFVSDMSFGALSQEAKTALGARRATRRDRHLLGRGRHAARGAERELPATSTSSRRPGSAGAGTCSRRCRRSTSSSGRARRREPADTCPARR